MRRPAIPLAPDLDGPGGSGAGLATLGVVAASICFGLIPFFARTLTDAGMAPHAVSFYRFVLTALVLSPLLPGSVRRAPRAVLWGLFSGAMLGLGWVGYVKAVEVAPVSTVGVLYMTYPVFTLVIGRLLFGERPGRRAVVGAGMIVAAAAIASSPAAVPAELLPALALSLLAPLGFGFGICVLVHKLAPALPAFRRIGVGTLGAALGLSPLMLLTPRAAAAPADGAGWLLVGALALGAALIPQLVYSVCAPRLGTARTAVAGSVELPAMFMVGWIAFAEPVGAAQWAACALVLAAIVLTPARRARSLAADPAAGPDPQGPRPERPAGEGPGRRRTGSDGS